MFRNSGRRSVIAVDPFHQGHTPRRIRSAVVKKMEKRELYIRVRSFVGDKRVNVTGCNDAHTQDMYVCVYVNLLDCKESALLGV